MSATEEKKSADSIDINCSSVVGSYSTFQSVPSEKLNRTFLIQNTNIDVTSLEVAAHGCFVVAGCSNGAILLFDVSNPSAQVGGRCIGHIQAKGIHTNLLLTVKISEDCNFVFAGVSKGSSEMLAIDLRMMNVHWNSTLTSAKAKKGYTSLVPDEPSHNETCGIASYSQSEPKLRGFGAATRVKDSDDDNASYLLATGRGIKNVHVWQFKPPTATLERPSWICIYDVATNGNTITHVGFRNGGMELLSKSAGMNIRVWDISNHKACSELPYSQNKPSYEDVVNSQDTKCLLSGGFAFGGTYEFSVVKIDAPREANRDAFEMPERTGAADEEDAYSAGLRRRRTMREIEDVICTEDGVHVLVLCTDGGVMYYQRDHNTVMGQNASGGEDGDANMTTSESDGENTPTTKSTTPAKSLLTVEQIESPTGVNGLMSAVKAHPHEKFYNAPSKLVELSGLTRDLQVDQAWGMRRVGQSGEVVLLRALKMKTTLGTSISLALDLLSNISKRENGESAPALEDAIFSSTPAKIQRSASHQSVDSPMAPFELKSTVLSTFAVSTNKRQKKAVQGGEGEGDNETPSKGFGTPSTSSSVNRTTGKSSPADGINRLVSASSPLSEYPSASSLPIAAAPSARKPLPPARRPLPRPASSLPPRHISTKDSYIYSDSADVIPEMELVQHVAKERASTYTPPVAVTAPQHHRMIYMEPANIKSRFVESHVVTPLSVSAQAVKDRSLRAGLDAVLAEWRLAATLPLVMSSNEAYRTVCGVSGAVEPSMNEVQRMGVVLREQERVRSQFVTAACLATSKEVMSSQDDITRLMRVKAVLRNVVSSYRAQVGDLVSRQSLECRGARMMDLVKTNSTGGASLARIDVSFAYGDMFEATSELQERVSEYLKTANVVC